MSHSPKGPVCFSTTVSCACDRSCGVAIDPSIQIDQGSKFHLAEGCDAPASVAHKGAADAHLQFDALVPLPLLKRQRNHVVQRIFVLARGKPSSN